MLKDALLAEDDHEMGTTRRPLDRIPDDKLAWKPHEKSMARGDLANHRGNIVPVPSIYGPSADEG